MSDKGKVLAIGKKVSTIAINENKSKEQTDAKQSANVNMSQTTEINPYLLLMAHAFIRNTILLDNNADGF